MRKINPTILSLLAFLMLLSQLKAQDVKIDKAGHSCNYCVNGEHTNESPYEINFKKEIPFFAAGIGLLSSGLILMKYNQKDVFTLNELNQLDANNVNRFDRVAINNNNEESKEISDILLYSELALPLFFFSNHHTGKDFGRLGIMAVEVFAITSGLTMNAKYAFNRTRPLVYNDEISFDTRTASNSRLSFFSGHTAQTAAFSVFMAKVIHDYHPNMKKGIEIGIWTVAITLPAAMAYLRVDAGNHFPSDVIVGYAIGASVGWLVPHLHKKKNKESNLSVAPFRYGNATGLTLNWKL
ncbi:MAG: phosphatase PAP2 family protein [Vicingaceae bacterium]|nr:phosphatase PAP2 family protein [Vicingaceae bacterium]